MIDHRGFRLNVGIVLLNAQGQVFWAKRIGKPNAWQFPQGGIKHHESLREAMFRELAEEIGLAAEDVQIIGLSQRWVYYRLPFHLRRHRSKPVCIGQKQRWFLLRLVGDESRIRLDYTPTPEFDKWQWVNYWRPIKQVIAFKRAVYKKVLQEFAQRFPIIVPTNSDVS